MKGLVDRFWLWERFLFPALVILVAVVLTGLALFSARIDDRYVSSVVAISFGFIVGVVFATYIKEHLRPKGE